VRAKAKAEGLFPSGCMTCSNMQQTMDEGWAFNWKDDGQSFTIHQEDWYMEHIIPMFNRQTMLRSIVSPCLSVIVLVYLDLGVVVRFFVSSFRSAQKGEKMCKGAPMLYMI
jgi:hypothetical protein